MMKYAEVGDIVAMDQEIHTQQALSCSSFV